MNRLFFLVLCSSLFITQVHAGMCDTGDMTVSHYCTNASCTETSTTEISRNTNGEIKALLGGRKETINVEDQDIYLSDYCNNPSFNNQGKLVCTRLGTTKTVQGWKQFNSTIYRVINGNYYKYNNGIALLNQKTYNSNAANNPIQITIGNICTSSSCTATKQQNFSVFSSSSLNRYIGGISSFTMKEYDTPIISSIRTDESKKTNNSFSYGASFTDRVPQGCTNTTYVYNPKVLTWNSNALLTEFTDSNTHGNPHITINKSGEIVTGTISESIILGQKGLRKIEMNIRDANGNIGTKTSGLMEVIQGDVNQDNSTMVSYQNTTANYYPGDTLIYTIILKDAAGNIIKDKPATFSHPTQNTFITYLDQQPIYSDANSGEYLLRIHLSEPMSFIENFRVQLPYWDDQGANINNIPPQVINLGKNSRIIMRDPNLAASEFSISCSRGPIKLIAQCERDNLSGCNTPRNGNITFTNESDNSSAGGLLASYDNAGNIKQYRYIMQHIDTTKPSETLKIGHRNLSDNSHSFLANNDPLIMTVDDIRPPGCGKNIAYTFSRSDNIGIGDYNFAGNIQAGQSINFGITNFVKSGSGQLLYKLTDSAGNITFKEKNIKIFPAFPSVFKSSITLVSPTSNSLYADNSSTYTYKISLKDQFDNPIYGKKISSVNQEGGTKTIKTDMTQSTPAGGDAIIEKWVNGIDTTNANGEVFFTVKSLTPGVFSEKFKISLHTTWDDNYQDTGVIQDLILGTTGENSFKKTFVGNLTILTSPFKLLLGTTLTMQLGVTSKSVIPQYTIREFSNQVEPNDSTNHKMSNRSLVRNFTENPLIDYRIDSKTDAGVNILPGVSINNNPIIQYILGGENISYRLSASESAYDEAILSIGGDKTSGLKVTGTLQGQGKQSLAGQKNNFSDISKSNVRTIIRKNAYALIRGRTSSEKVIGSIKYREGNYNLSGEVDYETLIIKNGNLSISSNFNTRNKTFGIIVLRDDSTNNNLGNIYIQPSVQYIQSVIYADGGIISTGFGNDTTENYKDSPSRTSSLNKQLVINGSIFTRNTIGGAILGDSGKYILPGGSTTDDFDIAMMYDLNYLRRWNDGYNISGPGGTKDYNQGNSDNVVIIANPAMQKSPPKGFGN